MILLCICLLFGFIASFFNRHGNLLVLHPWCDYFLKLHTDPWKHLILRCSAPWYEMLFVIFTEPDEQLREALHFTTIHPRDGSHAFGEHLLCTDDYCTNNNSEHRVAQSNHTLSTIMLITYHYSVFVHDNLLLFKRNVNDGSFIFQ